MFLKELKEVVLAEKEDVEQPAEQWTDKNRQKFQEIREYTIELKKAKVNTAELVGFLVEPHLWQAASEMDKVLRAQLYLLCLIRVCEEPEIFEDDKVKKKTGKLCQKKSIPGTKSSIRCCAVLLN